MKEAPGSSKTPVLKRATRRNNPEDIILHSYRRENLKSEITAGYHCLLRHPRKQLHLQSNAGISLIHQQEVLRRTNRLLSLQTMRTAWKTK
jgi:hypothetical protein